MMSTNSTPARILSVIAALLAFAVLCPQPAVSQQGTSSDKGNPFVLVKDAKGGLQQKLIVKTSNATIHEKPGAGDGVHVDEFSIFLQLKVDEKEDGADKDGKRWVEKDGKRWLRLGSRNSKTVGWIKEDHIIYWGTRFALEPLLAQQGGREFKVYADSSCKGEYIAKAKGKLQSFAPVLEAPKDNVYKIAFFAGRRRPSTDKRPAIPKEAPNQDYKFELIFVIDTTQSMDDLIDGTKDLVKEFSKAVENKPEAKNVRLGLVEYQDKVKGLVPSRLVCPLTSDLAEFRTSLATLKAATISSEDAPESGLAGLLAALQGEHEDGKHPANYKKPGWEANSSKHIILIGDASHHEGSHPKNAAGGLTIATFIDMCRKNSGNPDEKAAGTVTLHAIRAWRDGYPPEEVETCRRQFQALARNNGEDKGYYAEINPNKPEDLKKVVQELSDMLLRGTRTATGIAEKGELPQNADKTNPFEANEFEWVAAQEKANPRPVGEGYAPSKTVDGEVLAQEKVFVYKEELRRLKTTLSTLHTQFKDLANPKDRDGVDTLLVNLKTGLGVVVTGQDIGLDTPLEELFAGLPLTTPALKTTPRKLQIMQRPDFEAWLRDLDTAADTTERLIGGADWDTASIGGAQGVDPYTWILRSKMP